MHVKILQSISVDERKNGSVIWTWQIIKRRNCWFDVLSIQETGVNMMKPMVRMTETRKMTRMTRMMTRMMTMERGDSPLASCPHPPLHCRH